MKVNLIHEDPRNGIRKERMARLLPKDAEKDGVSTWGCLAWTLPLFLSVAFHLILWLTDSRQGIADLLDDIFMNGAMLVFLAWPLYDAIRHHERHSAPGIVLTAGLVLAIGSFFAQNACKALADLITDETEVHTGHFIILHHRKSDAYYVSFVRPDGNVSTDKHTISNATREQLADAKTIRLESWRRTGATKAIAVTEWKEDQQQGRE